MDGQTHDDSIYRVGIASRGKSVKKLSPLGVITVSNSAYSAI